MYDMSDGWYPQAQKVSSANFNERPENTLIDTIIIHCISLPPACYDGDDISLFFANRLDCDKHPYYDRLRDLKVSSHMLIRRNGELIQYVNFYSRAWHAGVSHFNGRDNCNDFSIGIELEGTDQSDFEIAQYHVLTELVIDLMAQFPDISMERIVAHSDVAPGRKTDPGSGFNWSLWRQMLIERK